MSGTSPQVGASKDTDRSGGEGGTSLAQVVGFLRRRWILVLVCGAAAAVTAYFVSSAQTSKYTATASLLFRQPTVNEDPFNRGTTQLPQVDPARQAATNVRLVSLPTIAARTADELKQGFTQKRVQKAVNIRPQGNSDVINVEASWTDRDVATRLANTFAQEFIQFRRAADRASIDDAQRLTQRLLNQLSPSERNGSQGRTLEQRAQDLAVLASLQTGNAELVQLANRPGAASSPRPKRDTAVGLLLGLIAGLLLAVALEQLERRFRNIDEIEAVFQRPLLGAIPEHKTLTDPASIQRRLPPRVAEAFQLLRANLRYFNVDRPTRLLMVTSSESGDGKSTVAYNLAAQAARTGVKTLLVEGDLRRPAFASRVGLGDVPGLTQVLSATCSMEDAIREISLEAASSRATEDARLWIMPSGPLPPNPVDLMESDAMRDLLTVLPNHFDLIVLDTPPLVVVSDAIPLIRAVDGVIVVTRLKKTRRDGARRLHEQLNNLRAPVMGVVVNGVSTDSGYGYGYEYLEQNERAETAGSRVRS